MKSSKKSKDPHAVALGSRGGRRRAELLNAEQRTDIARQGGLAGGKARAEALTKARRSEIAKKAAAARWGKKN